MNIDLRELSGECGPDCDGFLVKWAPWWQKQTRHPVALLPTGGDYMETVSAKTRNMVRKANSLYVYREFDYNDHLFDIYLVNTSKPVRSGGPMTEKYLTKPTPIQRPLETCDNHRSTWWGGFDSEGSLVGYCNLVIIGELGVINTILGHADAPAVLNGLFAFLVVHARVEWIHYLSLASSPDSLAAFKRRVGFTEVKVG